MDALVLGVLVDERFSDGLMFGGQLGGYIANRFRLAARLAVPTDVSDESSQEILFGYASSDDDLPSLLYGASVGVVVAQRTSFVFSPGFTLARTDVNDQGTIIGVNFPFEWVTRGGVRFGLEAAIGRGLGGTVHYPCDPTSGLCTAGEEYSEDRESGIAFMLNFAVGFGFGYPKPLPRDPEPPPAAPQYPAPPPAAPPAR